MSLVRKIQIVTCQQLDVMEITTASLSPIVQSIFHLLNRSP